MTDLEFFEKIKPYVIEDMNNSNILASLTAAQAFIESNRGNSKLSLPPNNNLFGIKGNYNGQSVNMITTEYVNSQPVKVYADFRKYPSWLESIKDHSDFLLKYKRYASIVGEKNYKVACEKMGASGYATSPIYGSTLLNIITKYRLYDWDNSEYLSSFIPGCVYTTKSDLFIRAFPDGEKVKFESITMNAKVHSFFDEYGNAILRKGTRVSCMEVSELESSVWIRIPSGWICGKNSTKEFVG